MDSRFKVVLLGEVAVSGERKFMGLFVGRVGKTSLVLRYCQNEFHENVESTIQATYLPKRVNLPSHGRVDLAIWDTAGQERFHALGPIYYRDANGALLVYDVTDPPSFQKVKVWVKELRKMLGNDVVICVAGNKIDLDRQRRVTTEEAEEYTASVGATHHLTSAKLNRGVSEVFLEIAKRMVQRGQRQGDVEPISMRRQPSLAIVDSYDPEPVGGNGGNGGCDC